MRLPSLDGSRRPGVVQNAPAAFPLTSRDICDILQHITNGYGGGEDVSSQEGVDNSEG